MFFLTLSPHIFSALVTTRRALRIRKNIVKLSLYNHLAYALIATVVGEANTLNHTTFTRCHHMIYACIHVCTCTYTCIMTPSINPCIH